MTPGQTIPSAGVTLAPMFEAYRTRLVNRQRKAQTVYNFTRAIIPLQAWLESEGIAPEDLTEENLYAYLAGSPFAKGTKHQHAAQVRAAYRYAHRKGTIAADPLVDFERPPAPDPEPKAIPVEELRRMHGECTTWKQDLLWHLLVYTGLRRDEIRRLCWDADAENRIDLAARTITVVGKGDKRRVVPIHPALHAHLERVNDVHMHSVDRVGAVLWTSQSAGGSGGIYSSGPAFEKIKTAFAPEHGFHAFRRTVASSLRRNKVDGSTVDRLMGWAAVGIRAKYYEDITADDLRDAMNRLYAGEGL